MSDPNRHFRLAATSGSCRSEIHWKLLRYHLLWAHASKKNSSDSGRDIYDGPPTGAWLVLNGNCRLVQDGTVVEGHKGQWVFPKSGHRDQYFEENCEILSIGFMARWPHGIDLVEASQPIVFSVGEYKELYGRAVALVERVEHVLGQTCDWSRSRQWRNQLRVDDYIEIEGRFLKWLAEFVRVAIREGAILHDFSSRDSRVDAAIAEIELWPMRQSFDPEEVAAKVNTSRRHLDHLFKQETGKSLRTFYENVHVQRVSQLLCDGSKQIKEIAYESGFEHGSNFARWFRGRTGMTPAEFRALNVESKLTAGPFECPIPMGDF